MTPEALYASMLAMTPASVPAEHKRVPLQAFTVPPAHKPVDMACPYDSRITISSSHLLCVYTRTGVGA